MAWSDMALSHLLKEMPVAERGEILLHLARGAISRELSGKTAELPSPAWLDEPGATFVTLTKAGVLRGCIGSLEAHRSLRDDVLFNARAAAFNDPRFAPLSAEELNQVRVEVSVLGTPEPIHASSEAEALALLRPGADGLILQYGRQRATFLPQVWKQLPHPQAFLAQLKIKAGLPPDFWSDEIRLARYGVQKWSENHD